MSDGETPGKKGARSASPQGAPPPSKLKKVERRGAKRTRSTTAPGPSTSFKMEVILGHLSPPDVLAFGATCTRYRQQSQSPWVWRRVCGRMPDGAAPGDWQRLAILKHTQALHTLRLGPARRGGTGRGSRPRPSTHRALDVPEAHGYQRVEPAAGGSVLLWDRQGTLHLMRQDDVEGPPARPTVLCRYAKDFAVDPRHDGGHREYVYVLATNDFSKGSSKVSVFHLGTGELVFMATFPSALTFTQVRLTGCRERRQLLLLSDTGGVYGLPLNESILLQRWRSFSLLMTLKTTIPDPLSVRQVHSSQNSALFLSGDGTACLEVYTAALSKKMFGTKRVRPALGTTVRLPLPTKVVKCAVGHSHLCLVDERGDVFTQGHNHFGQLGTGDRVGHGQLTQVAVSMRPVDVWCGRNHTLVLLQGECGAKELHGCGSGAGGRLPGHPKGSDRLVRLSVQVPRTACSISALNNCLYILSSHDISEPPLNAGRR
ncbi:unnamed protein product [Merluccius merluccius]